MIDIFEHVYEARHLVLDLSLLLLIVDQLIDQHVLPVMFEHLSEDLSLIFLPFPEDVLYFHQVCLVSMHMPRVVEIWNLLLPVLREHLVNIILGLAFFNFLCWLIFLFIKGKLLEEV